jgi:hypothetical protein
MSGAGNAAIARLSNSVMRCSRSTVLRACAAALIASCAAAPATRPPRARTTTFAFARGASRGAAQCHDATEREPPFEPRPESLPSVRVDGATQLRTCPPTSAEFQQARLAFDRMDATIAALEYDSDVSTARRELAALLAMPCFAMAAEASDQPVAANSVSLREWWRMGGGRWLESYVVAPSSAAPPLIYFPPTERHALTLETAPHDVLAPLLCAQSVASCGRETTGWLLRANRWFAAHAHVAVADVGRTIAFVVLRTRDAMGRCVHASRPHSSSGDRPCRSADFAHPTWDGSSCSVAAGTTSSATNSARTISTPVRRTWSEVAAGLR